MADQPIRASKLSTVKTSAEQDLHAAFSYVEDVEQPFFDKKQRFTFEDMPGYFATLEKAAEFVASARTKNPDQTITFDDKEGPITFTIDDVAGAVSSREGHVALVAWRTALNQDNKITALHRARSSFQKASRFCPDRAVHYINLAHAHQLFGDKPSAIESIAVALRLSPDDAEAIKLNGEISQLPDPTSSTGDPFFGAKKERANPLWYSGLAGVACLIAGMAIPNSLISGRNPTIPEAVVPLLMIAGWALIIGSIVIAFKMRKEYTEYRDQRQSEDLHEMITELHETRYRAERERKL